MTEKPKSIPLRFWRSAAGKEAVRDWLVALSPEDKRIIGHDLSTVQFGWPLGLPLCRSLGDGLWEVRSALSGDRQARVIFCFFEGELFALHAFVKKTQKTPQPDLVLARRRMKEVSR
jgi:phage-related protein